MIQRGHAEDGCPLLPGPPARLWRPSGWTYQTIAMIKFRSVRAMAVVLMFRLFDISMTFGGRLPSRAVWSLMRRSAVVLFCLVIAASVHVQAQGKRTCTKEDAIRAETESSSLQNWSEVYNSYRSSVHCDDASIAEGYSNSIAHLLSEEWDTIDQLNQLVSRDRNFEQFVLRHIDELMSPAQAEKIRENAVAHCTRRASRLCKSISIRLEQTRPSQEPQR